MITGAFRFNPDKVLYEMDDIIGWLTANGVVAADVPVAANVVFSDGQMTVDVHLRRDDSKYIDEEKGEVATGTVTVPLLVEPPDFKCLQALGVSGD